MISLHLKLLHQQEHFVEQGVLLEVVVLAGLVQPHEREVQVEHEVRVEQEALVELDVLLLLQRVLLPILLPFQNIPSQATSTILSEEGTRRK